MRKIFLVLSLLMVFAGIHATTISLSWTTETVNIDGVYYTKYTATEADTVQAADTAAYTAKLPTALPKGVPVTVIINPDAATLDDSTTSVNIYGGWSSSFALTVATQAVTPTDGCLIKAIESDVKATAGTVALDPTLTSADVSNVRVFIPDFPYYAFTVIPTTTFAGSLGETVFFVVLVPSTVN